MRCTTVGMQLDNALIPLIGQASGRALRFDLTRFEQAKVVDSPFAMSCADNCSGCLLNHYLGFEGMSSLLAAVEALLFFGAVQLGFL